MGGMDMSSDGMFRPYNQWLAEVYWYIVVGVVCFGLVLQASERLMVRLRYLKLPFGSNLGLEGVLEITWRQGTATPRQICLAAHTTA